MRSDFGRRCKGGSFREAGDSARNVSTEKLKLKNKKQQPRSLRVQRVELSPLLTERLDAQRVTQLVRASADVTLKLKRTLMVNVSGGERWCVQAAKQQEEAKEQAARTFKPSGPRRTSGRLLVRVETIPGLCGAPYREPCQCEEFFSPSRLPAEKFFLRCFSTPFLRCLTPMDVQTACPEICVGAQAPSTSTDSLVPHRCHRCKCHYHTHTLTG